MVGYVCVFNREQSRRRRILFMCEFPAFGSSCVEGRVLRFHKSALALGGAGPALNETILASHARQPASSKGTLPRERTSTGAKPHVVKAALVI